MAINFQPYRSNNIYLYWQKCATLESGEVLKGGIFTQQGFEFEPG